MMKMLPAIVLTALLSTSTTAQGADTMAEVRVSALRSGAVLIDGKPATLTELKTALDAIRAKHGAVLYYREGARDEPSDGQMAIFQAVVQARLPVSLSSKSDFSDYIDGEGHSQPR